MSVTRLKINVRSKTGCGLAFLGALIKAKLFRKRTPFFISWALTYRCNSRCSYCGMPSRKTRELNCVQVTRLLETLSKKGARFLSLTGGEPLLRDDIGSIVDFARARGMCVKLNSNGMLFTKKADELKNLSTLILSYDGPPQVHDHLRGAGSHDGVMRAVEAARQRNIPVSFYTVISSANLPFIKDVLKKAADLNVGIMFQPATQNLYGGKDANPVAAHAEKYKRALDYLCEEKKKGHPFILNSFGGLKHIARWPEPTETLCANGLLGCRIEPDGEVRLCSLTNALQAKKNYSQNNFEKSFKALLLNVRCQGCWCSGQIEMNRLSALRPDAVLNALKLFK